MNKGTLYYEETTSYRRKDGTPGKKGRWVGEILVDGRRVRMRSTNYRNVLLFLQNKRTPRRNAATPDKENLRIVRDLPGYWVDITNGDVYNKDFKKMTISNMTKGGGFLNMYREGQRYTIQKNRLWYAAINRLRYFNIPSSVVVTIGENGMPQAMSQSEHSELSSQKLKENRRKNIDKMLDAVIYEADMLKTFYQTNDVGPILLYLVEKRDIMVSKTMQGRCCSKQKAEDLFEVSLDKIIDQLVNGNSYITALTSRLKNMMMHRRCRDVSFDAVGYKII